ncbi:MAG: universal stress protein [Candidatus Glassbacteria bacterium]|nr:universal stress protein [Candidatus Glassbacteria bacterium]
MKKILVAIDFSAGSAQALHYALKFARQFGSDLLLLHVIHDPAEAPGFYSSRKAGEPVFSNMEEAASAMMDDFVAEHLQEWKKFEVRIIPGLPADEIVRTAEKEKAEMIVMGTSGHRGLKRLMIGSVAESVIRASACPVLAVRSQGGSSQ